MNILIVKLSAVGDVVHTLPSLAALRKLYSDAHITWVIEEAAADLVTGHPYLDRVLVSRRKSWAKSLKSPQRALRAVDEMRSFLRALRDRPYDLVIDFHGLFKSAVIVFLSRGKRKLGYDSLQELSGLFLNEKIPEDMNKHAVDRYLDFLRHLGSPVEKPAFLIPVGEENMKRVAGLLEKYDLDRGAGFVAVSPVALWETKLWEEHKFAALCDRIVGELGLKVVLTGDKAGGVLSRIEARMTESAVNLGGKTTLRDLAALYKKADVLVTTDSGPMHIAAAVGTPVIALFGPTAPWRTGPYGPGHIVIRKATACGPCFLRHCETGQCMKDITVEEVFEAVKKALRTDKPCEEEFA